MNNTTQETAAVADAIDFLEDVNSHVRDLLHTITVHGDTYVNNDKFRRDVEHLQGVVAQGI